MDYRPGVGWEVSRERAASGEEPVRRVACGVAIDPGRAGGRLPIRGLYLTEIDTPAANVGDLEIPVRRSVSGPDWRKVSRLLAGSEAIFTDARREAPPLQAELAKRGLPGPASVRSLLTAVRGSARIPRGSSVEEICQAVGAPFRDGETPVDAALNVEACVRAAQARRRAPRPESPSPERKGAGKAAPASLVLTAAFLRGVPGLPGVYRFHDGEGRLLYVGKAVNLRRRLSTYASLLTRGAAAGKATRALQRLDRVTFEVSGSELEALLREARLIRRRDPVDNVQRAVHDRGRAYASSRSLALLLPSKARSTVTVIFVRDGRYEGSSRLGPMGGGRSRARSILKRLYAPPRSKPGAAGCLADRDSEILNSWLARSAETVSRVDLDSRRGADEAFEVLEAAAAEFLRDRGSISHHR